MRISDWSSDVCSSDLPFYPALTCGVFVFPVLRPQFSQARPATGRDLADAVAKAARTAREPEARRQAAATARQVSIGLPRPRLSARGYSPVAERPAHRRACRSEEHTSELQSLMRNSYAVFCLKKQKK